MIREGGKRGTYSGVEISGGKCSKSNEAEKAGEHLGENMARGREEKKKHNTKQQFLHTPECTQCNVHSLNINQHVFKYIQRSCSQKVSFFFFFFFFLTQFWI